MYTFQDLYNRFTKMTKDSSAANITFGKDLINETQRLIIAESPGKYLEDTFTQSTVASQQSYKTSVDIKKIISIGITVGGIEYPVEEIANATTFDIINRNGSSVTSDIPQYYHVRGNDVMIYPTPASSGNTISILHEKFVKDMTADDYTTGTITTLANGGTAVTGSGTTWTSAMVGRFIRITADGFWYKITAVGSTTTLTIEKPYEGTAIAAGSEAYTIGEMPIIPFGFHELLWYRPVGVYYLFKGTRELISIGNRFYSGNEDRPGDYEKLLKRFKKYAKNATMDTVSNFSPSRVLNPNFDIKAIDITEI